MVNWKKWAIIAAVIILATGIFIWLRKKQYGNKTPQAVEEAAAEHADTGGNIK
jgi:hypothetical protein